MRSPLVASLLLAGVLSMPAGCGSLIVQEQSVEALRDHPGFTWIATEVDECVVLAEADSASASETPSIADKEFDRLQSAVSYPAAGSFVRLLRDSYGIDTVRAVWDGGWRSLPTVTGRTMSELESEWLVRVDDASGDDVLYDPRAVTPSDDRR